MSTMNLSAIQQLQLTQRAQLSGEAGAVGKSGERPNTERSEKMREAAKEFEAIFARQLFKQMNQSSAMGADKQLAGEFYQDMLSERVADMAADRGELGIARLLERAWGLSDETEKKGNNF
ncbi:flagellar biosynthesis protein FlgI [Persicimonas caeni]|uniref:Flagellar biosynthesis protein FlgI n=1 Tax=Persicimonas caeni TaxID=2292766 RepID=A0A4Y6PT88_PERCE|nr:flagellar biosynthesis protein FlgI [Persicimonas caeni]QDG51349.1 flagellar biosynthesis protein FlgI [Persicimonas caeni]QED32570.1 flagellar biosynthesis protein FlgI [Persicimonas caeni]